MTFKELTDVYTDALSYANRMMSKECLSFYKKTKNYWEGYKYSAYKMYGIMKCTCSDYRPTIQYMDNDATYCDTNGNIYKACGVLSYREEIYDIFCDECGQQVFTICRGQVISGGSFNLVPEYDLCDEIDRIIDNITF